MRAHFAAVLPLFLLCGCRTPEKQPELSSAAVAELTGDAVGVVRSVYPPARTRLRLQAEAADSFGISLLEALRAHGYAVAESAKANKSGKSESPPDGLDFSYALVFSKTDGEARLILRVGAESLSRLYAVQETDGGITLAPLSAWSRKQ